MIVSVTLGMLLKALTLSLLKRPGTIWHDNALIHVLKAARFVSKQDSASLPYSMLHLAIFHGTCLAMFKKSIALQLHKWVLHCAMGLPETHKTATEENQGEENEDPDWHSIARQVAWGVLLCATLKKWVKFYFLQHLRQQQNCETSCCLSMLHLAIFGATCITQVAWTIIA